MLSSIHDNRRNASPSATRTRRSRSNRNIEVSGRFSANVRYNEPAPSKRLLLAPSSLSRLLLDPLAHELFIEEVRPERPGEHPLLLPGPVSITYERRSVAKVTNWTEIASVDGVHDRPARQ